MHILRAAFPVSIGSLLYSQNMRIICATTINRSSQLAWNWCLWLRQRQQQCNYHRRSLLLIWIYAADFACGASLFYFSGRARLPDYVHRRFRVLFHYVDWIDGERQRESEICFQIIWSYLWKLCEMKKKFDSADVGMFSWQFRVYFAFLAEHNCCCELAVMFVATHTLE